MSVFKADCPYCFTRSVAFTIVGGPEIGSYRDLWDVLAFCSRCDRGIVATFSTPGTDGPEEMNPGVLPDPIAIFPRPPETAVPEHTPRNVGNYFRQARDSLASGNWDAAGVMYRKVLETCLKHRFPHHRRDDTLYKRIETAERGRRIDDGSCSVGTSDTNPWPTTQAMRKNHSPRVRRTSSTGSRR